MAKLPRKEQKIFAGSASNNGQFGSAQLGTKVTDTDLDVLQALAAFDTGWLDATLTSEKLPTLEEMQALHYITTTQLSYIFQEGIVEYLTTTTYFTNSIVKKSGTYELYGSKINDNVGNALPVQVDNTEWEYIGDLTSLASISAFIALTNVAQEWTKTQNFNATVLTDAATIAWDAEDNQVASVTLGGNRTLGAPTNLKDGATYILTVKQDGSAPRTLAYNAVFKFPDGTPPVLSIGNNDVDILTFVSDGINMYGVIQKDFG